MPGKRPVTSRMVSMKRKVHLQRLVATLMDDLSIVRMRTKRMKMRTTATMIEARIRPSVGSMVSAVWRSDCLYR